MKNRINSLNIVTLSPVRRSLGGGGLSKGLLLIGLLILLSATAQAQEFANIEYLCCDWGPAMKLATKEGEKPQFNYTGEEIYFLKQVGSFSRKKLAKPGLFGETTQDTGKGLSVYLCKMKADGSGKTEIKELWKNPFEPIETQTQSCWMDVNEKTRKIALAIRYAASDLTGLWTMNLDGGDLKRIITPENNEKYLQAINHPSWTPDGQWIVFEEGLRGPKPIQARIVKCGAEGKNIQRLTEEGRNEQPSVSPDGTQIVYVHGVKHASRLYLMKIDGADQHPLPNPDDKRWGTHGGYWPAWSPDGKQIYYSGIAGMIVDSINGNKLWAGEFHPHHPGWCQWGKKGLIGHLVGGIVHSNIETKQSVAVGPSHMTECKGVPPEQCIW